MAKICWFFESTTDGRTLFYCCDEESGGTGDIEIIEVKGFA